MPGSCGALWRERRWLLSGWPAVCHLYNAEGIRIAQGESAQRSSATLIPWEQAGGPYPGTAGFGPVYAPE